MKILILAVSLCLLAVSYDGIGMAVAQNNPAPVPMATPTSPANPTPAAAPAPQTTETVEGATTSEEAQAPDGGNLWSHGSLMFDSKTSEWIHTAVKSHTKQIPLEILLPSLFPQDGKPVAPDKPMDAPKIENMITEVLSRPETPKEAPTFYLKTILYFSQNNWSLWLNDKKITDKTEHDETDKTHDITIVKISRAEVIFLWKDSKIDKIYPHWKEEFVSIEGEKYTSPEKNIVIDAVSGNVSFVLKPNQTLVTNPLVIIEGKASATGVVATIGSPAPAQAPTNPAIPPVAGTNKTPVTPAMADKAADITKLSNKNIQNSIENLKNLEILKSVLDQNEEKLGK